MWVGFYILANATDVPGHTLPKNEILLIVRSGPDVATPNGYTEPIAIKAGETDLKSYRFDEDPKTSFLFTSGSASNLALQTAIETGSLNILMKYKNGEARKVVLDTKSHSSFRILAEMLQVCGSAIAG
jgi:hypothetical protein